MLPLYVRAGSILPLGSEEEYTDEHPSAPIELRIYPGADGNASLYYDDGLTYNYQKGQYAWLPLHWTDASRTLTLDARQGQFTGAPESQEFHVTLVAPRHGIGEAVSRADRSLTYHGVPLRAQFQ